jgi:cytoskeleton protein RodZ
MSEFRVSAQSESAQAEGSSVAPLRLRQAREATGLHIAALAAALKVPVRKLEALEAGRYHELPDMTFARALASSACRHLKVDPVAVLEQIPGASNPLLGVPSTSINAPFKPGDEISGAGVQAWLSRPVVWVVGLLLLAAGALALLPQGWVSDFQETVGPSPGLVVEPLVAVLAEPVAPLGAPSGDAVSAPVEPVEPVVVSQPALDAQPVASPEVLTPMAAQPVPVVSGEVLLSIRAVNESWIEVASGSGPGAQVLQRVLKPGEVLDLSTAPPYAVVVGRADAVQVTVRGQPFDVMPFARNSVARFEVK